MARKTTRNGRTVYIPGNAPDKFFYSLSKAKRYERTCGGWAAAKVSTKSSRARNARVQFVKAAKNPGTTTPEGLEVLRAGYNYLTSLGGHRADHLRGEWLTNSGWLQLGPDEVRTRGHMAQWLADHFGDDIEFYGDVTTADDRARGAVMYVSFSAGPDGIPGRIMAMNPGKVWSSGGWHSLAAKKNPADTHEERRERDRLFPVFMRAAPTDPEDREEYMEALYLLPVEHLREADPSNLIEVADAYNDSTGWPPEDSW